MDPLNTCAKFEVRSFTRSWDNRGYSKNLGSFWIRPHFLFSQIFKALLVGWILWIYLPSAKFEVRSSARSWDNRGYWKKFGQSLDTPTLPFLQNFSWACDPMDLWICLPNFKSLALAVPEIIVIAVLGWSCEPQSRGRGGRRGSRMVPFERAFVTSYRPSIVTFPLSLRVSVILRLLCSSMPLFPTPPLVSPKFPHVPLGIGGWPLGCEERRCWANWPCN